MKSINTTEEILKYEDMNPNKDFSFEDCMHNNIPDNGNESDDDNKDGESNPLEEGDLFPTTTPTPPWDVEKTPTPPNNNVGLDTATIPRLTEEAKEGLERDQAYLEELNESPESQGSGGEHSAHIQVVDNKWI